MIPNSVACIGNGMFAYCYNLKSITIPDNITSIGDGAFSNCTNLTTITIPNSVTSIGNYAFQNCTGLTSITISNSVKNIDDGVFQNCKNLTSIIIPSSVISIGDDAFYNCTGLVSVTIPYSVTRIRNSAFYCCFSLSDVYYNGSKEDWDNISISYANDCLTNAVIYCNDGAINERVPEHIHTYTKKIVPSTCRYEGYTIYRCECGYNYIDDFTYIDEIAHNYNIGVITKAATCTATGVKTYTCTECKATKNETIAKKKHTYKNVTTKATTKKNGKIENKCTACGNVSKTTVIYYPKTITLSKSSYTYDGKAKKPSVTVKDSKGKKIDAKYYDVKYASNKAVGNATVTITFKGNYSGTVKKTFTIKPKATSISKLTAGKKKFTVKWKKQSTQTSGYEIQYATDSKFTKNKKTVTIKSNKTTLKSISKLKAKKKYYVRIRTYKTVNGKKIYSAWSKAKSVTTKK